MCKLQTGYVWLPKMGWGCSILSLCKLQQQDCRLLAPKTKCKNEESGWGSLEVAYFIIDGWRGTVGGRTRYVRKREEELEPKRERYGYVVKILNTTSEKIQRMVDELADFEGETVKIAIKEKYVN